MEGQDVTALQDADEAHLSTVPTFGGGCKGDFKLEGLSQNWWESNLS